MRIERDNCPWASKQHILDIVQEVHNELEELEEELHKIPKNGYDLAEELADVFSDVLLLLHIAERDQEINNKEVIVDRALQKKIRRKGWLLEGKKLSQLEASKYWNSAKEMEKNIK